MFVMILWTEKRPRRRTQDTNANERSRIRARCEKQLNSFHLHQSRTRLVNGRIHTRYGVRDGELNPAPYNLWWLWWSDVCLVRRKQSSRCRPNSASLSSSPQRHKWRLDPLIYSPRSIKHPHRRRHQAPRTLHAANCFCRRRQIPS